MKLEPKTLAVALIEKAGNDWPASSLAWRDASNAEDRAIAADRPRCARFWRNVCNEITRIRTSGELT